MRTVFCETISSDGIVLRFFAKNMKLTSLVDLARQVGHLF